MDCIVLTTYILTCFDSITNRVKTNITRNPDNQMVSALEHLYVGYYNAIFKKKAQAHVNEGNVVNYIMCPTIMRKLRHVYGNRSLVNPYQKLERLLNRVGRVVRVVLQP